MHLTAAADLVRAGTRAMASADQASALVLRANERVVDWALAHDALPVAHASMSLVGALDHIGSAVIALVALLLHYC